MTGLTALVGSGEYLEGMNEIDRRLLAESDKPLPRVICLATAAGYEGPASVERWSQMGITHFRRLGAEVEAPPVVDRASADDPQWAAQAETADLIYFSGGDPLYLYCTLAGTRMWAAVESAWARGAVFAGCSAGAMILGAYVPDVRADDLPFYAAFNKLPNCLMVPHFDLLEAFRPGATDFIRSKLIHGRYALGIDENTALVGRIGAEWEVMGAASAWVMTDRDTVQYPARSRLTLPA